MPLFTLVDDAQTFKFRPRPSTKRVIIHSSHTPPSIRDTTEFLRARGRVLGLLEVGYHIVIERDGWMTFTRPLECMGSHAPGFNHDSIGVCLAGDHGERPTVDQVARVIMLMTHLEHHFGRPIPLVGHSELRRHALPTDCPGFPMDTLRKECCQLTPPLDHDEAALHQHGDEGPVHHPTHLSTQCTILLGYLEAGRSVSNLIALVSLGIGSLTSRVAELRAMGHDIVGTPKVDTKGRHYISYTLGEPK